MHECKYIIPIRYKRWRIYSLITLINWAVCYLTEIHPIPDVWQTDPVHFQLDQVHFYLLPNSFGLRKNVRLKVKWPKKIWFTWGKWSFMRYILCAWWLFVSCMMTVECCTWWCLPKIKQKDRYKNTQYSLNDTSQ